MLYIAESVGEWGWGGVMLCIYDNVAERVNALYS
jgi:hypothetical protein